MLVDDLISSLNSDWMKGYSLEKVLNAYPYALENSNALSKVLNHQFKSHVLPIVALTHSSALVKWQRDKAGVFSNEKLEFLGDSLLNFYITVNAAKVCPTWTEGELSRSRARLASTDNLSKKALKLKLQELMIFGSEESKAQCSKSLSVMADAFEAISASLLLDAGLENTFKWLDIQFSEDFLLETQIDSSSLDVKSNVQSWLQRVVPVIPEYRYYPCPNNKDHFICEVYIFGHTLGVASGPNKHKASVAAAQNVWKTINEGHLTHSEILKMKLISKV